MRGRSGPDQKQRSQRKRISGVGWRNWRHARCLRGKMDETALRGLCQPSIHNKYVPCSFHSLPILIIFLPHSLSTFVRSLVRSPCPLFLLLLIHRDFLFPRPLFPANDTLIEPLLTVLNSTTTNRLIFGFLTRTPTTCLL